MGKWKSRKGLFEIGFHGPPLLIKDSALIFSFDNTLAVYGMGNDAWVMLADFHSSNELKMHFNLCNFLLSFIHVWLVPIFSFSFSTVICLKVILLALVNRILNKLYNFFQLYRLGGRYKYCTSYHADRHRGCKAVFIKGVYRSV